MSTFWYRPVFPVPTLQIWLLSERPHFHTQCRTLTATALWLYKQSIQFYARKHLHICAYWWSQKIFFLAVYHCYAIFSLSHPPNFTTLVSFQISTTTCRQPFSSRTSKIIQQYLHGWMVGLAYLFLDMHVLLAKKDLWEGALDSHTWTATANTAGTDSLPPQECLAHCCQHFTGTGMICQMSN